MQKLLSFWRFCILFFCWFSSIVQTEQTSSKFEKLSRHCPGFLLLLQWSIIAEIESVNWEGIRNFLARVWKIAMRLEVEKKCWENIKGRKDQEEGCCSVHFRQTNSKELGARGKIGFPFAVHVTLNSDLYCFIL